MKRFLYESLVSWKHERDRVPLILRGARQVGKSYLLKAFGDQEFSQCFHFDFEKNGRELIPLFRHLQGTHLPESAVAADIVYESQYF